MLFINYVNREGYGPVHPVFLEFIAKERQKRMTVRPLGPKNTGEGRTETCVFRRQEDVFHLRLDFSARLTKTGSTQALALLALVTPPAAAPGRCRPWPPWATPIPSIRLGRWLSSLGPSYSRKIFQGSVGSVPSDRRPCVCPHYRVE